MISNSVTLLRSYTNSAIADIAGNSVRPPMLHPHRGRYRHIEWRVFCDVSQCFKCFMMFYDISQYITMFYKCFMMFHYVLQVFHDVSLCFTMLSESRCGVRGAMPLDGG